VSKKSSTSKESDGKKERSARLVPACHHRVDDQMEVRTVETSDQVKLCIRVLTELLASDHLPPECIGPSAIIAPENELVALVGTVGANPSRFDPEAQDWGKHETANPRSTTKDLTSIVVKVDYSGCILCERCIRACNDIKQNFVIGRSGKGYSTKIGFDLDVDMGESSCVECGECMLSCPTDALTFNERVPESDWYAECLADGRLKVTASELKQISIFSGLSYKFLDWNRASVVRWNVTPGDVLCWQGDYGTTAFIINRGKFDVRVAGPSATLAKHRSSLMGGVLGRFLDLPAIRKFAGKKTDSERPKSIPLDQLPKLGEHRGYRTDQDVILGEMTCLSHYPRSATVVALEDGVVFVIRRNVLHALQRNDISRGILESVYRRRALQEQLCSNDSEDLFVNLTDAERGDCAAFLADRVELTRLSPGQVIFEQGEVADHLYLIHIGFVRVSVDGHVVDYMRPGSVFGERGLLSADETRRATCQALDDVELVRIPGEHFKQLMIRFPKIKENLNNKAVYREEMNIRQDESTKDVLKEYTRQGIYNAHALLVLDLDSCTRCDECSRACSDTHRGVTRLIREGERFGKYLVASSCRSCSDPYCLVGCPVDAISRPSSTEVIIAGNCIGCGQCAENCPYGNINMYPLNSEHGQELVVVRHRASTCDLCTHIVGPYSPGKDAPIVSCVYACPHHAAFRMTGHELLRLIQ
jgi:CRP-like cAMP-binding protein